MTMNASTVFMTVYKTYHDICKMNNICDFQILFVLRYVNKTMNAYIAMFCHEPLVSLDLFMESSHRKCRYVLLDKIRTCPIVYFQDHHQISQLFLSIRTIITQEIRYYQIGTISWTNKMKKKWMSIQNPLKHAVILAITHVCNVNDFLHVIKTYHTDETSRMVLRDLIYHRMIRTFESD